MEGAWQVGKGKAMLVISLQVGTLRHWGDCTLLSSPGGWQVLQGPVVAVPDPAPPQTRAGALQRGEELVWMKVQGPSGGFLQQQTDVGSLEDQ